eukprot:scaffold20738_cov29-Tisochrysis_lutea.AAC.6
MRPAAATTSGSRHTPRLASGEGLEASRRGARSQSRRPDGRVGARGLSQRVSRGALQFGGVEPP